MLSISCLDVLKQMTDQALILMYTHSFDLSYPVRFRFTFNRYTMQSWQYSVWRASTMFELIDILNKITCMSLSNQSWVHVRFKFFKHEHNDMNNKLCIG